MTVPVNRVVRRVIKHVDRRVRVGAGGRNWAGSQDNGPEDAGARLVVMLVSPK